LGEKELMKKETRAPFLLPRGCFFDRSTGRGEGGDLKSCKPEMN